MILYHVSDVPINAIDPGELLFMTAESAWSWARDNNWRTKYIYTVDTPFTGVQVENDYWRAKQKLNDVVLTPYKPEAENPDPKLNVFDKMYLVERRKKEYADRFTDRDPFIPMPPTPGMISTEPPARLFRGPHRLQLQDMVNRFAKKLMEK